MIVSAASIAGVASRRASRPAAPRHYVLGGQVSLFSNDALRDVAARNLTRGPWDTSAQVEDMQITGDLRALRYSANVSVTALAYAGPMLTLRSLWAQRRKWDEGMSRLLVRSALNKWTATLWRQQLSLLSNGITRIGFVFLLTASLMVGQYKWNWLWVIPLAIAVLLLSRPSGPSCPTRHVLSEQAHREDDLG